MVVVAGGRSGGFTSWVGVENLNSVAGCQSLLQQRGELLGELLPVLVAHLVLEAVQDLREGGEGRKKGKKKHHSCHLF